VFDGRVVAVHGEGRAWTDRHRSGAADDGDNVDRTAAVTQIGVTVALVPDGLLPTVTLRRQWRRGERPGAALRSGDSHR
jgi:hypothetical protein